MKDLIIFYILFFSGLSTLMAQISFSELESRNGIYYKIGATAPFSGAITEKYKDGKKHFIAHYKAGKLDGEFIEWYKNGNKCSKGYYKKNKLDGLLIKWLENGQTRFVKNYKDGKLNGVAQQWHMNGKKYYVKNYRNDMLNGEVLEWYNNGRLKYHWTYKNGKIIGERIEWDENGKRKNLKDSVKSRKNNVTTATTIASSLVGDLNLAQAHSKAETTRYHGIRPDDPGGRNGLLNPERGWRNGTSVFAEPTGKKIGCPAFHLRGKTFTGYSDQWWILDAQRYKPYGLTLVQTYVYLNEFSDQPISEEKLRLLQNSFDNVRKHGLKVLLRFAYEKDTNRTGGPTVQRILEHIDQLKPLLRENADIIYVLQATFVGAWGEWHSSTNYIEENHEALAAIVAKELEALPVERMIQVRVPKYKRWVLSQPILGGFQMVNAQNAFSAVPAARIGFENDGFFAGNSDGGTWPEPPFYANPGNPEFDYMTMESAYVPVDGELYWSDQGIKEKGGIDDGLQAAIRMRLHHYSTFSLEHSYSGSEGYPSAKDSRDERVLSTQSRRERKLYTIDRWMHTPLTLEQVKDAKLPISDGYFQNAFGDTVARTQFEYITDHLGYRIELQKAVFRKIVNLGDKLSVEVELINRGFATFINPRPVYFVLIDASGDVVLTQKTDANPQTWQPYEPGDPDYKPLTHAIKGEIPTKEVEDGEYMLGLWLPDGSERIRMDSRYAVRTANRDVPWWTTADGRYGVNILGTVTIVRR